MLPLKTKSEDLSSIWGSRVPSNERGKRKEVQKLGRRMWEVQRGKEKVLA